MLHRIFWVGVALVLWAAMAFATVITISPEDKVRQSLQQNFPEVKIDAVVVAPASNWYQVTSSGMIFYVTPDGRYLMSGELIDLQQQKKNLTETARQALRLRLLNTLNAKDAIVFAPPTPTYTVTVFTDPDCAFCRKLHQHMAEYHQLGIAVRYLAFPRQGIGSPSFEKAVSVWCALDRQAAFNKSEQGEAIEPLSCVHPIEQQFRVGMELGITGTPSIVFEDGSIAPGYVPPSQLLQMVQAVKKRLH